MEEYWSDKDYRRYGSRGKIYPDGTIVYAENSRILVFGPVVAVYLLVIIGIIFFFRHVLKRK